VLSDLFRFRRATPGSSKKLNQKAKAAALALLGFLYFMTPFHCLRAQKANTVCVGRNSNTGRALAKVRVFARVESAKVFALFARTALLALVGGACAVATSTLLEVLRVAGLNRPPIVGCTCCGAACAAAHRMPRRSASRRF
jgi:hypothetical protein